MSSTDSPPSPVSQALASNRLGTSQVIYFVLASIGPLLVTAGLVPSAFAATGQTGVTVTFLMVAVILAVFSVGYVAMSRRVRNAGAFYALIAAGSGRVPGVSGAMVALVAYNLLQVAVYGMIGPQMASFASDNFGLHAAWWVWALAVWLMVAVLGLVRVEISGRLLGVLSCVEIVVILTLTVDGLAHPAGGHTSFHALSSSGLNAAGFGPLLAIAVLGFVGFEQAVLFSEEVRDPQRTIPRATFIALGGIAVLYAASSFALTDHYGDQVVSAAQTQGSSMLFALAGGFVASVARTLFLTSLFAAALAFHNASWRYMFSLGREGVLPPAFGRTRSTGVPRVASVVQSVIGLAVIALTAAAGWDPVNQLFYWAGTTGGFGILILLAVTSISVVFYFRGDDTLPFLTRIYNPALAAFCLGGMAWLCADHYSTLLGVGPTSQAAIWLPCTFVMAAVIGAIWALILKYRRPEIYDVIGLGPETAAHRGLVLSSAGVAKVHSKEGVR